MSNDVKPSTNNTRETTPSVGKGARNIDPDRNPWERQPTESELAYAAFEAYRDSEERRVSIHGSSAYRWSSEFSWAYRVFEWDRYLARKDAEDAVRYRRRMNDRQRRIASLAQSKIIEWLSQLDSAKIAKLTASEAARWLEVAVKIERLAGGADTERLAIAAQGPIENLSAEEVNEALAGLVAQINAVTQG